MAWYTPRINLVQPAWGEDVSVDQLNQNFEKIDTYGAGPTVCTSTSRPNAPYNGQMILETDTGCLRVYVSGLAHPWRYAGGRQSFAKYRRDVDVDNTNFATLTSAWSIIPLIGGRIVESNGGPWTIQNGYPNILSGKWYEWEVQLGFLDAGNGGWAANRPDYIQRLGVGVIDFGDVNRAGFTYQGVAPVNPSALFFRAHGTVFCNTGIVQVVGKCDSSNGQVDQALSNFHTWLRLREID